MRRIPCVVLLLAALVAPAWAQQGAASPPPATPRTPSGAPAPGAMTNADVIALVKAGTPDATVIAKIDATRPVAFDLRPAALTTLKEDGVADRIISEMMLAAGPPDPDAGHHESAARTDMSAAFSAMLAGARSAAEGAASGAAASAAGPIAPAAPAPAAAATRPPPVPDIAPGEFRAILAAPGPRLELRDTTAHVAGVPGARSRSVAALAGERAVNAVLTSPAAQEAVASAEDHAAGPLGSLLADSDVSSAVAGLAHFFTRSSTTWVWAIPGRQAAVRVAPGRPVIRVGFAALPGIDTNAFAPVLVRLATTSDGWRIVGAAKGAASLANDNHWQPYENFVQTRVPAGMRRLSSGLVELTPSVDLAPGEYAVVLRPIDTGMRFDGSTFADGSGNARLFDAVFDFSVTAP